MRLVVCLLYVMTCTRPDISFPTTVISRLTTKLLYVHWLACLYLVRYLKSTVDIGICFYRAGALHGWVFRLRLGVQWLRASYVYDQILCLSLWWSYCMEELPPDHRGQNNHWSRILCLDGLFLMKWHLWNSYCLNWVSRLKPSQSTKTAKLQSTWLAILSNTSESSILTYGITLSARRCWRDGHRTEDPHKSQPFDMYTKAVSKVVFDTLSLFIVCRTETLWWYYGHYYSKDIFMIYAILLILDVVCDEIRERYCSDLEDMSQVSFMCSLNTGGVLTWNLGSSKLSCASTGDHAERSASRSWCLKSRSVFY